MVSMLCEVELRRPFKRSNCSVRFLTLQEQFVASRKVSRASQIHDWGWS